MRPRFKLQFSADQYGYLILVPNS